MNSRDMVPAKMGVEIPGVITGTQLGRFASMGRVAFLQGPTVSQEVRQILNAFQALPGMKIKGKLFFIRNLSLILSIYMNF